MEELDIGISGMRRLIQSVKERHKVDLGVYATTFFMRRVAKIMLQNSVKNIDELILKIDDTEYFANFQRQLTVDGTELFRDPGFWRYFKNELCPAFARSNSSNIKIWMPGCNSGEEIVSAAITLMEGGIYEKCVIIANDINQKIVNSCKLGIYTNNKLELSENNYKRFREDENASLQKYITANPTGFMVNRNLYKNVQFDVVSHSGKYNTRGISLILCRNYFIYFTSQYQDVLLEKLTENLNLNGYLAIGNKENFSFCNDASKYLLVNEKENVYKKILE